jgi:hypothetical protein
VICSRESPRLHTFFFPLFFSKKPKSRIRKSVEKVSRMPTQRMPINNLGEETIACPRQGCGQLLTVPKTVQKFGCPKCRAVFSFSSKEHLGDLDIHTGRFQPRVGPAPTVAPQISPMEKEGGQDKREDKGKGKGVVIDLTDSPPSSAPAQKKQKTEAAGVAPAGNSSIVVVSSDEEEEVDVAKVKEEKRHIGVLEFDVCANAWFEDDDETITSIDQFDSEYHRRTCPEGFKWSCCGKRGDEDGCVPGKGRSIKEMYAGADDLEDAEEVENGDHDHDGTLEVDWSKWPGHDEKRDGNINTAKRRMERPEGFKWTCCDAPGNELCCETATDSSDVNGWHDWNEW